MIRAILACDEEWGIGKNGGLPWPHNPADLKWFKKCTLGGVVVMGKSTWDSLPDNSQPLPGRNNVIVTSSIDDKNGPYHYLSFDQAGAHLKEMSKLQNIWVIGGAKLVDGLLPIIDEIWLSRINGIHDCDTILPIKKIKEQYLFAGTSPETELNIEKWIRDDYGPNT